MTSECVHNMSKFFFSFYVHPLFCSCALCFLFISKKKSITKSERQRRSSEGYPTTRSTTKSDGATILNPETNPVGSETDVSFELGAEQGRTEEYDDVLHHDTDKQYIDKEDDDGITESDDETLEPSELHQNSYQQCQTKSDAHHNNETANWRYTTNDQRIPWPHEQENVGRMNGTSDNPLNDPKYKVSNHFDQIVNLHGGILRPIHCMKHFNLMIMTKPCDLQKLMGQSMANMRKSLHS